MDHYFLGVDVGGTRTRASLVNQDGRLIGFGEAGPGNHESVGEAGFIAAVETAVGQAFSQASCSKDNITGAGFGIAGYDFPSEREIFLKLLSSAGYDCQFEIVNDSTLGLLAGSQEGWGIAVVSGTGCNCRGWDKTRSHEGRITGHGLEMGEGAGASELIAKAKQSIAYEWTMRGPHTALSDAFIKYTGACDLEDLLEGLQLDRYILEADAAPLVFKVAADGDIIARELISWAGQELGELVKCVSRQLNFQQIVFDVVMIGSMFENGEILISPFQQTVHAFAPDARFIRLTDPPVIGAVILGMETAGWKMTDEIRQRLSQEHIRG
jgi:N-acetylglucosamine kinase-like BadF-type ATPase